MDDRLRAELRDQINSFAEAECQIASSACRLLRVFVFRGKQTATWTNTVRLEYVFTGWALLTDTFKRGKLCLST